MAFHHTVQFQEQKKISPQFDMGLARGNQVKTKEIDGLPKSNRLETIREQK
jgi:hypothetical protein